MCTAGGYSRLPLFADVDRRGADVRGPDGRRTRISVQRRRTSETNQSTGDIRRAAGTHGSTRRARQHDRPGKFVQNVHRVDKTLQVGGVTDMTPARRVRGRGAELHN